MPHAAFVLAHIAGLCPRRDFDLVLASSEPLDLPSWLSDLGIVSLVVPMPASVTNVAKNMPDFLPPSALLRLFLPDALKDRYNRYLYLDIDVFVLAGDLTRLMQVDLGSHAIAAVRDCKQWMSLDKPVFEFEANNVKGGRYLNSGVLVVDIERWTKANLTERILEIANKGYVQYTHDQGLMNLTLQGQWAELHPAWNWHQTRSLHLLFSLLNPNIIHFAGLEKPWASDDQQLLHNPALVSTIISHLGRDFPDQHVDAQERTAIRRPVAELWRTGLEYMRLRPYLRRFADRYTTVL